MTASINHEINNPLTTVIGNIELLLMANPHFDDRVKNRLNIILEEARRIGDITNHLRDMKKKYIPKYLGENMPDGFTKKE
jgi:signal transduction histidine kinase